MQLVLEIRWDSMVPNPSVGEMSNTIHHAIDSLISTIAFGILIRVFIEVYS